MYLKLEKLQKLVGLTTEKAILHCKLFHCKICRFSLCPFSHCNFTAVWAVLYSMQWTTVVQLENRERLYFLQLENCNSNSLKPTFIAAWNLLFQQFNIKFLQSLNCNYNSLIVDISTTSCFLCLQLNNCIFC